MNIWGLVFVDKRFLISDIFVILIVIFAFIVRYLTIGFMMYTAEDTKADIDAVYTAYEANPVAKFVLQMRGIKGILTDLVFPAILIATYIYFRSKVKKGRMDIDALRYHTNILFFAMLINVINDATYFIARIM